MLARLWFAFSLCCLGIAGVLPAQAAWRVTEGIDIATGGASTLLIGDLDERTSLYARCVAGKPELFVDSYDGNDFELEPVGEVSLTISTDTGRSWVSPARYGREKSGYITTTWLDVETISSVIGEVMAAKAAISVSIEFEDTGASTWDTDAKGSTAAGKRFLEACPATAAAAPAAQPSAPPAWGLTIEADPVNGGQQTTLVGDLDQGGYFYAFCDGRRRAEVAFLSANPAAVPYQAGDVGLTLRVQIDGEERSATGEHFVPTEGMVGIRYAAPEYIESLVAAVGAARSEVAMMIESYSTGMVTRWPAKNLQGLGEAAAGFVAQCFGTPAATTSPPALARPAVPAPLPWELKEVPNEAGTDYVLAGDTLDNSGIVALSCSAGGVAHVIITNSRPDALPVKPGDPVIDLLVEVDGRQWKVNAGLEISPEGTATLYSASPGEARAIAQALADGAAAMQVGVRNPDTGASTWSPVDLTNAAQAAAAFVPACFGETAPAEAWQVETGPTVSVAGAKAVLIGQASPSTGYLRITCSPDASNWSIGFAAHDAASFPVTETDGPFTLRVTTGDNTWEFSDARLEVEGDQIAVVAHESQSISELSAVLYLQQTRVGVAIESSSGLEHNYDLWLEGMVDASLRMFKACYGLG